MTRLRWSEKTQLDVAVTKPSFENNRFNGNNIMDDFFFFIFLF